MMAYHAPVTPSIRVDTDDRIELAIHRKNGESVTLASNTLTGSLVINSYTAINFTDAFNMTKGIMLTANVQS